MPNKYDEPHTRVHIWMPDSDIQFIKEHFGSHMGFSEALRTIIRSSINAIKARTARHTKHIHIDGIDSLIDQAIKPQD